MLSSHIEMLHSVGSNVYTCLHRTEQPPATAFMHLLIFDACCIMGNNSLGDNFARGCGGG